MKNKVVFGLVSLIVFISLSSLSALSAEEQQQTTSISALERANQTIDACYLRYSERYPNSVKRYIIWVWEMDGIRNPFSSLLTTHARSFDYLKGYAMKNSNNIKQIEIDFTQLLDLYNDLCSVYLDPDNENRDKTTESFRINLTTLGIDVYTLKEKIRHDKDSTKSNEREVPSYWWD